MKTDKIYEVLAALEAEKRRNKNRAKRNRKKNK